MNSLVMIWLHWFHLKRSCLQDWVHVPKISGWKINCPLSCASSSSPDHFLCVRNAPTVFSLILHFAPFFSPLVAPPTSPATWFFFFCCLLPYPNLTLHVISTRSPLFCVRLTPPMGDFPSSFSSLFPLILTYTRSPSRLPLSPPPPFPSHLSLTSI